MVDTFKDILNASFSSTDVSLMIGIAKVVTLLPEEITAVSVVLSKSVPANIISEIQEARIKV